MVNRGPFICHLGWGIQAIREVEPFPRKSTNRIHQNNWLEIELIMLFLIISTFSSLTVVSHHLLSTPTAVSTQSKRALCCNSHFIHCTKIEVGDGV